MDFNHFMDAMLTRWSKWLNRRFIDRSMGFASSSSIDKFGTPPATGKVYDISDYLDETDQESVDLDKAIKEALGDDELALVVTFYVQTGKCFRKTARAIKCHPTTVKNRLAAIQEKLKVSYQLIAIDS